MSLCSMALIAVLASTAVAAESGVRCPDGGKPEFTGHPFMPYACRGARQAQAPPSSEVKLSSSSLPGQKDRKRTSLKPLEGRWAGLTPYGAGRYEILLEVRLKGRGAVVRLETVEYHVRDKSAFAAELRGSFWHPGELSGSVHLEQIPGSRLKARTWLGAAGADSPQLDRELVVVYEGRPELHRLDFALEGDERIRYRYSFTDAAGKTREASGELSRTERKSL